VLTRTLVAATGLLALIGCLLGLAFAGSSGRIAEGVTIAGVDVGGLDRAEARAQLEERWSALERTPVTFVAGTSTWKVSPIQLGVKPNFAAAVDAAAREGEGFGPIRGFRRLQTRFFGLDLSPPTQVFENALNYEVGRIEKSVARDPQQARIKLKGLRPVIVPEASGRNLDRRATEQLIVRSLSSFSRTPVGLPVRLEQPKVTRADLAPALAQTRVAVSAPVRLAFGPTRWRLPRWRIAQILALPHDGSQRLSLTSPGADRYFQRLAKVVNREPVDAGFSVSGTSVSVIPAKDGYAVDVRRTARALLAAAVSPINRTARLSVVTASPERSTAEAAAMGIRGYVAGYTTTYGGEENRLHNVRLVAQLIDGTLIAPGATFSFNQATGARTADKGFLEAPVIINGELQTGLGGGVCQVSTTVFNAAYEAGLSIESRTNHALYISHYPLGRDATVNYPDIDLRFKNDSGRWLLLRTFIGASSLTVNLYGTPLGRRVVSEARPLEVTGDPPVEKIEDPDLYVGERVVVEAGEPSRKTSVRRLVYGRDGKLMYDSTWLSEYRAEPTVIQVGTKPKPKPQPKKDAAKAKKQKQNAAEAPPADQTQPAQPLPEPLLPAG
jgi:vancomycin resistance protein YoaR